MGKWFQKNRDRKHGKGMTDSLSGDSRTGNGMAAAPENVADPVADLRKGSGAVLLDTEKGIRIVGGSLETYCMILETYVTECGQKLEQLMQIEDPTQEEYRTIVHAFRGSGRTIGAEEIADLSERLETASRNQDLEYVDANTPVLYQKMTDLFHRIREYVGEVQ